MLDTHAGCVHGSWHLMGYQPLTGRILSAQLAIQRQKHCKLKRETQETRRCDLMCRVTDQSAAQMQSCDAALHILETRQSQVEPHFLVRSKRSTIPATCWPLDFEQRIEIVNCSTGTILLEEILKLLLDCRTVSTTTRDAPCDNGSILTDGSEC